MNEGCREAARVVALVPTYNGERFVAETLASLAAQNYPNLEVVILDDASTDRTWEISRSFADRDERFRCLRQPSHLGWIGNANALLELAEGAYAFFAPHDDIFERSYVSRMVRVLERRPEAVLAFSQTMRFDETGPRTLRTGAIHARPGGRIRRGLRYLLMTLAGERATPFRGVVRRDALRQIGHMRQTPAVAFGADVRWLFRLSLIGAFAVVPEVLCQKRVYPPGVIHGAIAGRPIDLDLSALRPLNRVLTRARNACLNVREALMYASEIRAAQLPRIERAVLLAGVPIRMGLVLLPGSTRRRAIRLFARI